MGYELRSKLAFRDSTIRVVRTKGVVGMEKPGSILSVEAGRNWDYSALQPIDTAPTDGTVFLGYRNGQWGECYRVQRDDCEMWSFRGGSADVESSPNLKPTHWMPLPAGKSPA